MVFRQESKGRTEWLVFKLERRLKWSSTRSVLGPLLFVIHINDIDESLACSILKFADDTKIYSTVSSSEDIDRLRVD